MATHILMVTTMGIVGRAMDMALPARLVVAMTLVQTATATATRVEVAMYLAVGVDLEAVGTTLVERDQQALMAREIGSCGIDMGKPPILEDLRCQGAMRKVVQRVLGGVLKRGGWCFVLCRLERRGRCRKVNLGGGRTSLNCSVAQQLASILREYRDLDSGWHGVLVQWLG